MLKTKTIFIAALLTAGLFGLSNLAQTVAQSTDQGLNFPYQALVLSDGASVHSGPGQVHYGTQNLKQGDAVEVYRHDPGGWCAIRPLEGSFSLVPESTLKIVEKGVGEINADGTQAWVGTKLGPVDKPLWQVKLKKGEPVEVIGQVGWPDPEGHSTLWYQIAPPAGEFRWIKISDLQLPVAVQLAIKTPTPPSPVTDSADTEVMVDSNVQLASMQVDLNAPEVTNGGWRQAKNPIRNRAIANNSSSSSYQRKQYDPPKPKSNSGAPGMPSSYGKSPDFNYQPQARAARVPVDRYADARPSKRNLALGLNSAKPRNLTPHPTPLLNNFSAPTILTTHRIDDLEHLLTREMLRDPDQWKLEDLETRAANISRMTTDPNEKILADKFRKKIENCRTIKFGFESQTDAKGNTPRSARLTGSGSGTRSTGSGTRSTGSDTRSGLSNVESNLRLGTTYDAHGWLNQMVTDGGQGPPSYVLQDENGKITHHVSPIQGMNWALATVAARRLHWRNSDQPAYNIILHQLDGSNLNLAGCRIPLGSLPQEAFPRS